MWDAVFGGCSGIFPAGIQKLHAGEGFIATARSDDILGVAKQKRGDFFLKYAVAVGLNHQFLGFLLGPSGRPAPSFSPYVALLSVASAPAFDNAVTFVAIDFDSERAAPSDHRELQINDAASTVHQNMGFFFDARVPKSPPRGDVANLDCSGEHALAQIQKMDSRVNQHAAAGFFGIEFPTGFISWISPVAEHHVDGNDVSKPMLAQI